MKTIAHPFHLKKLQNISNTLKENLLPLSLTANRILWVVATVALFAFALLAGCLTAYLLGARKLNEIKGKPIFSNTKLSSIEKHPTFSQNRLHSDLTASISKKEDIKESVDLTSSPNSTDLDKTLPQTDFIPPGIDYLHSTDAMEKEIIGENSIKPQNSASCDSPAWLNDHPEVSLLDLKLMTYDAILDFLRQHGNQMKSLNLGRFQCTDDEFEALIKLCPHIQCLFVSSFQLTDQALGHLKGMPLTSVDFSYCDELTDKALAHLEGMHLTSVGFSNCYKLTDKSIGYLKGMPLISINFEECNKFTDKVLEYLIGIPLTSINFGWCHRLTDKAFEYLKGLPLKSINFTCCDKLTDEALKHLKGMPLTSIDFSNCCKLTDKALEHLMGLPLTSVDFSQCKKITDKAFEHLNGMSLLSVNFNYCPELTDTALEHLKGMPLNEVEFHGCGKITNNALEDLRLSCGIKG